MHTGVMLAALGLAVGANDEPAYEFKPINPAENSIAAVKEKDRTVFVVTNPLGIGRAGITLKSGRWPANITLRFRRSGAKGGGFTNLEYVEVNTDRVHCVGSLGLSGRFEFGFLDERGRKPRDVLSPDWVAGRLRVLVEERDGAIEVTLPPRLLAGSNRLELSWIDAHRR